MADDRILTDEMKRAIVGRASEAVSQTVEQGAIRRFAEAIEDTNPLWTDEAQARRSRYGGIVAPPTFLRSLPRAILQVPELDSLTRVLDAGSEWRYEEPARVGDVITAVTTVQNVSQRTLSIGPAVFVVAETRYTNQLGQLVATQRSTMIRY
jgi:acyl dehydratase